MLTDTAGGVTVGCRQGTTAFQTLDANGTVTQSRPATTDYFGGVTYSMCLHNAVVGADGTLFVVAHTSNSYVVMVKAIKNNIEQWSYTLPCRRPLIGGMAVGTNGNLYLVLRDYSPCATVWRLLGLSATAPNGSNVPAVVFDQPLNIQGSLLAGGISVYSNGITIRTTEGIQYFAYSGSHIATFNIADALSAYAYTEYPDTDLGGIMAVPIRANQSVIQQCGNNTWVAGSIRAYSPSGQVWSYSSLPHCTQVYDVRPSPNGVVVYYAAPQGGVYGNPLREYLLAIDGQGNYLWQTGIISTDPSVENWLRIFKVDLNGNIALVRQLTRKVSYGGSEYKYPTLHLTLLSGTSGNVISAHDFVGNHTPPGGNGYRWAEAGHTAIARGVWYTPVWACQFWWSCNQNIVTLYPVSVPGLEMDYPRGAILGQSGNKVATMVGAGDSFSSGLGALGSGQAYSGGNCARSPGAYANLLSDDTTVKLTMPQTAFVACAGATAADVLNQVGSIPANAKAVFLTVGGNDAKFARLGALCIFVDCSVQQYQDEFEAYLDGLDTTLANVYSAIAQRAPDAHVYVLNYPHIMPLVDCEDAGSPWWMALLNLSGADIEGYKQRAREQGLTESEANLAAQTPPHLSNDETLWSRTFQNQLNLTVSDAVDLASASFPGRVHLVRTTLPGSPLEDKVLCSPTPYFNGLDGANPANTFHPNALGQQALKQLAREALAQHQPQYVTTG